MDEIVSWITSSLIVGEIQRRRWLFVNHCNPAICNPIRVVVLADSFGLAILVGRAGTIVLDRIVSWIVSRHYSQRSCLGWTKNPSF